MAPAHTNKPNRLAQVSREPLGWSCLRATLSAVAIIGALALSLSSNSSLVLGSSSSGGSELLKRGQPVSHSATNQVASVGVDLDLDRVRVNRQPQELKGEESDGFELMGEENIGRSVNKSLMSLMDAEFNSTTSLPILPKQQQLSTTNATNETRLNNMRRLLVRQLTNLIMNHEPETIAESMEGTRVSGQLISGAELPAQVIDSEIMQGDNSGAPPLESMWSSDSDELPVVVEQRQQQASSLLGEQVAAIQQQQQGDSEQNFTCPPDYDDPAYVETNASNLTSEQQRQLLAETIVLNNLQGEDQAPIPKLPSHCAPPGSRMIEMITKVITPILFSIIIVVGLLGNIIVMLVILEDRKTERELTPTNLLILDLSLADLSFIIFCIPFTGWDYAVGHWVFGPLWCKFNQYLIVVCALSSIYTLVLMSIDRFMAIVYPIECMSYRTSKNMLYGIYIKWILILIMASPTIAMHGLIESPLGPEQFNCRFLTDQYDPLQFQIIFFISSYLFPLILIFCLYLSLLNKLWFGSKPHGHKESLKMLESKKKVTWLVAGIVVVFALCWCPIQVMLILMRLKSHRITATYVAIQVFAHTLGYMNSCVNPIVYAFVSETFHNSFKRSSIGRFFYMCLCIKQQQDHDRHSTNFRTIHSHATPLKHTSIQSHHQHLDQHGHRQEPLNNAIASGNGGPNNSGTCNDNNLSTTTLLMTSNCNSDNNNRMVVLPLEPRDRGAPVSLTMLSSPSRQQPINARQQDTRTGTVLIPRQPTISGDVGLRKPAKQQLVARVVQSGNQVSHQCEPGYQ